MRYDDGVCSISQRAGQKQKIPLDPFAAVGIGPALLGIMKLRRRGPYGLMGELQSPSIRGRKRMKRIFRVAALALLGLGIAGYATYVFGQTPTPSVPTP